MPGEIGPSGIQSPSRSVWNGSALRWAAAALSLWFVLVVAWTAIKPSSSSHTLCLFHSITGMPCPTCGSTRAVLALGRGEFAQALAWNPLVIVALVVGALWLGARTALGWRMGSHLSARQRRSLLAIAAMFAISNWIWVIVRGN